MKQNTTLIVTGGRGFIGRAVTKLLRRKGYRVISVDQTAADGGADEVVCNIADQREMRRLLVAARAGGILHLAAILPTAAQHSPVMATRVNVEGSLSLLELAREFSVRRFVFGSSLSVYGTYPAEHNVSESDRTAPEDLYGAAKLYVEQLGEVYRASEGVEFASLRIGRVVGAGANSATSAWRSEIFENLASRSAAQIILPYTGAERVLLAHVEDVAGALAALALAADLRHTVYNAPCESVVVEDLKRKIESLNSNVAVRLGESWAAGNPRQVDSSRFFGEFGFPILPIFERMERAAGGTGALPS